MTGSSLTTNPFNAKEELLDYLPFGTIRIDQKAGDYTDQRKFAGYEYDNDTGLSYANARYYDGGTGRFISQDPAFLAVGDNETFEERYERTLEVHLMDPQSLNSYSYVNNNPLKYTDPEGEIAPLVAIAAGWAITEAALFVNDVYNAAKTVTNPNASWTDKGISVAGAGVGLIAPGGGYGQAGKAAKAFNPIIQQKNWLSGVKNEKVANVIKDVFRAQDKTPGGTIEAIRRELATGQFVGGKSHIIKGQDTINRINNIFQTQKLSPTEVNKLNSIKNSLQSLLKSAKK